MFNAKITVMISFFFFAEASKGAENSKRCGFKSMQISGREQLCHLST